ncbi:hypothetical protein N7510_009109 [Penicillium lagena]|uniref:uncharacterized protein n=1 Tax=Penicillium lagena TaxID=94218 RepID=UPI002541875D|nr:uncharacterized protein N7510_009109 [Penicillium lagena]KAJ5606328.1 hypothetical protein N7510_009109 [Penicillium lagena]
MGTADDSSYRALKPLPFELVQHTGIFFEEKLYTQALNLLLTTLTSGTVTSGKVISPCPQHLALAATFLVHPSTTTRARSAEEKEAAIVALRLLRLTNTLIGPREAKFGIAFSFTHFETSRHGGRRRAVDDTHASTELASDDTKPLNLDLGQSASLWSRATDFWHAVGWAFNCSVLHPERWERWQVWLQYMCEVINDDWDERVKIFTEQQLEKKKSQDDAPPGQAKGKEKRGSKMDDGRAVLRESLIFQYIVTGTPGFGRNRRILRSIFADGGPTSVSEFREVFSKELKPLKRDKAAKNTKKREVEVNIDKDEYGDYLSRGDATDEENTATDTNKDPSRPASPSSKTRRSKRTRRGTRNAADPSDDMNAVESTEDAEKVVRTQRLSVSNLGGHNSLALRQRLLNVLSFVSDQLPNDFISLNDLYHLFVENIRPLPLPVFQAIVSPYVLPGFCPATQSTLCEKLMWEMIESAAPGSEELYLTQAKLEQCFLPFGAATASTADNAKISILLESMIILLANDNTLSPSPSLREALMQGIQARADKAQEEIRRNQNSRNMEPLEWSWLLESGERLILMLEEVLPLNRNSA